MPISLVSGSPPTINSLVFAPADRPGPRQALHARKPIQRPPGLHPGLAKSGAPLKAAGWIAAERIDSAASRLLPQKGPSLGAATCSPFGQLSEARRSEPGVQPDWPAAGNSPPVFCNRPHESSMASVTILPLILGKIKEHHDLNHQIFSPRWGHEKAPPSDLRRGVPTLEADCRTGADQRRGCGLHASQTARAMRQSHRDQSQPSASPC